MLTKNKRANVIKPENFLLAIEVKLANKICPVSVRHNKVDTLKFWLVDYETYLQLILF